MPYDKDTHFFEAGELGKGLVLGACGGKSEERLQRVFSPEGQSGKRLRQRDPNFESKTKMNVSRQTFWQPRDTRTQPTPAQCRKDKEHMNEIRAYAAAERSAGGKVEVYGTVAKEVLKKEDIIFDEWHPHPSGRNSRKG